jgi:hypothetical protein
MMLELAKRARAAGFRRWMLNVKPENVAALQLYEQCGMQVALESAQLQLAWADVAKLPTPPAGTTTGLLAPSDDGRVEQALGLSPGDFSCCRALTGRVFMGATADSVPVACIAFDPKYPGAPVLRARSAGYARAVLESILPHALPPHDRLFLFLEGDRELESTFVGIGARVTTRVLRMEGDIEDAGRSRGSPPAPAV